MADMRETLRLDGLLDLGERDNVVVITIKDLVGWLVAARDGIVATSG